MTTIDIIGVNEVINKEKKYEIKTFDNFMREYGENYRYKTFKIVLLSIKDNESNGGDPLEFLWNEYYTNKLSTIDIYEKYAHYGNYNNSNQDTFEKIFKVRLNWTLRKPSETTDKTKEKIIETTYDNIEKQKIKNKKKVQIIIKILNKFSIKKIKEDIDLNSIMKLNNNNKKIKYILDKKGYIRENHFNEIIVKLKQKYGVKVTALAIENILQNEGFKQITASKIGQIKIDL